MSEAPSMAPFVPISIDVVGERTAVRWIERADTPTAQPFFLQMVRDRLAFGAAQRVTSLDTLLDVPGRDPVGLVMHLSRCGSTLLMQALSHGRCIAPISEATPVNQLLAREDIPAQERTRLLRGLVRALGSQDDASSQLPYLIKFTSWNVLFLDIVRAAFPDTPWLFLYREPLEAMASHWARPAKWLIDDGFVATLAQRHRLPFVVGLDREQRCAAVLAAYGRAVLDASAAPINLLNYTQLPAALLSDVPARFGVSVSVEQQADIADASRIYSKDTSRRLVFDPANERRTRCITDRMRAADLQYTRQVHGALERRRLGAAASS